MNMSTKKTFPDSILLETLDEISKQQEKDVTIYLIGGGAMIFYGRKASTKDIDIVFTESKPLEMFVKAATKAGLKQVESQSRENLNLGAWTVLRAESGIQLDLFLKKVCNALTVKESVIDRARHYLDINSLHIYLMSPEDIVLFKAITERESDLDDIRILAESGIDWNIVEEECLSQENSGAWANLVLDKLRLLKERYGINPRLDRLVKHADRYVLRKSFESFLGDEELTFIEIQNIVDERVKYSLSWTRSKLRELEKEGFLTSRKIGRKKKYKIKRVNGEV